MVLAHSSSANLAELQTGEAREKVARALEPMEREAARERQGTRTDLSHVDSFFDVASAKLAEAQTGETRDKVAAFAGIGRTSLAKATFIVEAAEAEPEKYASLLECIAATSSAFKQRYRRIVPDRAAERLERQIERLLCSLRLERR